MSKSLADKVVEWALGQEEFAGYTVERHVDLKGQKKGIVYRADILLRRLSRLSFLIRGGPLSGSAVAITLAKGSSPVTARVVVGVQRMAADVIAAVMKGREGCPVKLWIHVSTQPFEEDARGLAGQMRLVWFGRMDGEGNVEQVC